MMSQRVQRLDLLHGPVTTRPFRISHWTAASPPAIVMDVRPGDGIIWIAAWRKPTYVGKPAKQFRTHDKNLVSWQELPEEEEAVARQSFAKQSRIGQTYRAVEVR